MNLSVELGVPLLRFSLYILALSLAACSGKTPEPESASSDTRIDQIANAFVAAYYQHYPEYVYEIGYPDAPMDRFGNHSESATAAWKAEVDAWLAELNTIDLDSVNSAASARTYVFAREKLQSIVDRRVCNEVVVVDHQGHRGAAHECVHESIEQRSRVAGR